MLLYDVLWNTLLYIHFVNYEFGLAEAARASPEACLPHPQQRDAVQSDSQCT